MEYIKGIDESCASRTLYNTENRLVFDPLCYEQRYIKTANILSHEKFGKRIKNILEFGVAELKFFVYIKNGLKHATRIDQVDIDGELLERFKWRIIPLMCEHITKREQKLTARIWKGSVSVPNPNFTNVDAVVAIELIEHVFPDVLEEIPFNIFGTIKPKIAIITTPNCEFNVLFDLKPFEYRHDDHKFEWTRAEFQDWCNSICTRFPEYCVQFHGIGLPPAGRESLGCCSQMGFFMRKDFLKSLDDEEPQETFDEPAPEELIECPDYQLIHSAEYPFFHDTRSRDEKILDECNYHLNRFRFMEEDFFNYETDRFEIPLKSLTDSCWQITDNADEIRSVLKGKFQFEENLIILPPNEMEDESEQEDVGEEGYESYKNEVKNEQSLSTDHNDDDEW